MRLVPVLALLAVAVAACSGPGPSTTSEAAATTAPTTTQPATTTTLAPLPFTALGTSEAALGSIPDGPILTAGVGRRLGVAFDDLAGGIIFEQLVDGVWTTWYLEAGRQEPGEFSVAGARLGDVDFVAERPVTAALWADDALILQTVKGGAPEILVRDELPLPPAEISGLTLGGDLLGVSFVEGDCHDLVLLSISGELVGGPLGLCSSLPVQLTSTGEHAVAVDAGASTRVLFIDPGSGEEAARWQVAGDVLSLSAGSDSAVVAGPTRIERIDVAGTREQLDWAPLGAPVAATDLRAPITPSDLASLGGLSIPVDCSASGLPDPAPSSGLTPAADETRSAIVAAALDCNYWRLAGLADPLMEGGDVLSLTLIAREAEGIPVTADIVNTIGLPQGQRATADGGVEFVWPSILDDEPTDEDWELLRLLYNEERIAEWREGRAPFDGLSIVIAEDGAWTALDGIPDA